MITRNFKIIFFSFICILSFVTKIDAQQGIDEGHIKVAMRVIGDKILLNAGDGVSRILAIEKEGDRYKIQFEADFQFTPDEMVTIIDQVVKETEIAISYLVEVEECETSKVIYGYEISSSGKTDLIPCKLRIQPKACYELFITILDTNQAVTSLTSVTFNASNGLSIRKQERNYFIVVPLFITLLMLMGLFIYFRKKKLASQTDTDLIYVGKYQFDKKNMLLSYKNERIELSSRETDLLFLLYISENKTLERERILNVVWGDEGDYIGRTLDVFISKLRKKLVADPSLKIVNIRGVGYKFIINNQN